MDLAEKYRPRTLSEVRGNRKAVEELRKWALSWPSDKSAALLYGRPGTGKTSAAVALARDLGWQLLELNASDKRTQGVINEIAGEASKNASLLYVRKLILLDEIDNLHGTSDRGGPKAVTELVKKTREPVILTANDLYGVSSTLRGYCKQIPFFAIKGESAQKALLDIWNNEKRETLRAQEAVANLMARLEEPDIIRNNATKLAVISADLELLEHLSLDSKVLHKISKAKDAVADLTRHLEQSKQTSGDTTEMMAVKDDLDTLKDFYIELGIMQETLLDVSHSLDAVDLPSIELMVQNAKGDLRSAINDFQAYVGGSLGETTSRDRTESTFDLMRSIFGDRDPRRPLALSYAVDETPEDLVHWIDENLPRALKGEGLAQAFQVLSMADVYLGRTRKRQNYGLWKYANELMTSGINVAAHKNHEQRNVSAKYSPPTHWMRLGQTRAKRGLRDEVASKIAVANHISVARAREEMLPLYKEVALKNAAELSAALNLNAEQLSFLMGAKKDAAAVKKGIVGAEQLISERVRRSDQTSKHSLFNTDGLHSATKNEAESTPKLQKRQRQTQAARNSDENRKYASKRGQKYLDEFYK